MGLNGLMAQNDLTALDSLMGLNISFRMVWLKVYLRFQKVQGTPDPNIFSYMLNKYVTY
jgi:hypothetical protein